MASTAVGLDRVSTVVGYSITAGNFNENTPNLPQRIAIIGEANTDNQSLLSTEPTEITTLLQAGQKYGFGSPIYHAMRILRPVNGDGVGGIPTVVYAQEEAVGAVAKELEVTVTGTATGNGTHTLIVNGRRGIDGDLYNIAILSGDTPAIIHAKIEDVINNVLASPCSAVSTATEATLTAKWKGLTSNSLNVTVDTNGNDLGLTYAFNNTVAGSGTPSIDDSLQLFGNEWNTIVLNCYGIQTDVIDSLESFNGKPDPTNPTGRYTSTIVRPFIAFTGSVADEESTFTNARPDEVTIAICPTPLSSGFQFEGAANYALLASLTYQNTPHLDIQDKFLPDMPTPTAIGSMSIYSNRDVFVKRGCSTVDLVNGKYQIKDFVTTYHPTGDFNPVFRFVRDLVIDFNFKFGYYLKQEQFLVGYAIARDNDIVTVQKVVKPKIWKSIVFAYIDECVQRGIVADAQFSKDSTIVNISNVNPNRIETSLRYKRTGFSRIASTTVEVGFNFSN